MNVQDFSHKALYKIKPTSQIDYFNVSFIILSAPFWSLHNVFPHSLSLYIEKKTEKNSMQVRNDRVSKYWQYLDFSWTVPLQCCLKSCLIMFLLVWIHKVHSPESLSSNLPNNTLTLPPLHPLSLLPSGDWPSPPSSSSLSSALITWSSAFSQTTSTWACGFASSCVWAPSRLYSPLSAQHSLNTNTARINLLRLEYKTRFLNRLSVWACWHYCCQKSEPDCSFHHLGVDTFSVWFTNKWLFLIGSF